jgi:hypothetical protein
MSSSRRRTQRRLAVESLEPRHATGNSLGVLEGALLPVGLAAGLPLAEWTSVSVVPAAAAARPEARRTRF